VTPVFITDGLAGKSVVFLLSGSDETVRSEIPVVSRLAIGSERLRLFLTDKRILVAHVGKRGTAAVATASLFGRLSSVIEDLFKRGKESMTKRTDQMRPADILATDKDNFSIGYDEVVSVRLVEAPYLTLITMVTTQDKLEFSTSLSLDNVLEAFEELLTGKLDVDRLRRAHA